YPPLFPDCCLPFTTPIPTPQTKPLPKTKETAPKFRAPIIQELKTVNGNAPAPSSKCRVGFWNFTNRAITIENQNITRKIPASQGATLVVNRDFTWRVDGQPPQQDRVPDQKNEDER